MLKHRDSQIRPQDRAERLNQNPVTIWLTGLVASGKTEIAYALEKRLFDLGATCIVLDGVNIRLGLSRGLDFGAADRAEHLRRVAEICRLHDDAGIISICGFVSPSESIRKQVAEIVGPDKFLEIHVDASSEWCERRDDSGLYKRAKDGEMKNMAGVNAPYDIPTAPSLTLSMENMQIEEAVDGILNLLRERNFFPRMRDRDNSQVEDG